MRYADRKEVKELSESFFKVFNKSYEELHKKYPDLYFNKHVRKHISSLFIKKENNRYLEKYYWDEDEVFFWLTIDIDKNELDGKTETDIYKTIYDTMDEISSREPLYISVKYEYEKDSDGKEYLKIIKERLVNDKEVIEEKVEDITKDNKKENYSNNSKLYSTERKLVLLKEKYNLKSI